MSTGGRYIYTNRMQVNSGYIKMTYSSVDQLQRSNLCLKSRAVVFDGSAAKGLFTCSTNVFEILAVVDYYFLPYISQVNALTYCTGVDQPK